MTYSKIDSIHKQLADAIRRGVCFTPLNQVEQVVLADIIRILRQAFGEMLLEYKDDPKVTEALEKLWTTIEVK